MRRLAAILLLPLLAAAAEPLPVPPAERALPLVRNFPARQYRGHDQIWAITETRDGLMLFANLNRVTEFDGLSWRNIDVPGGSYIRAMVADAEGTVWLGGADEVGRLVPGTDGRLAYESLRHLVAAELGDLGNFWAAHARPDGVWLQANNALLRWNGRGFDTWKIESRGAALSYAYRDEILVCADKGWFTPLPGGGWRQVGGADLAPWLPRFLLPGPDGTWLAGTGTVGIRDFRPDGTYQPQPTEVDAWLGRARPYSARRLADGRILIHSLQGGAVLLGPDLRFQLLLDGTTGLDTNTVITSFTDRRGVLWLGTDKGISRVELDAPATVFDERQGLGRSGIEAMERVDGRIIVTTADGALGLEPAAAPPAHARFAPLPEAREHLGTVLRLPDGVLVGGVGGVFWISGGRTEPVPSPKGVREIVESPNQPGRFFGTHLNGLCSWRRVDGRWELEGDWTAVAGELRGLVPAADGALWTSTPNRGVLRIEPDPDRPQPRRVDTLGDAEGLPVQRRRVWLTAVGGAPLFQTASGMFRYDPAARRFRRETGYGVVDERVRVTHPDGAGGLWMVVEDAEGVPVEVAHGRDGVRTKLPVPDLAAMGGVNLLSWEARDGREVLWIGTESQLRQVDLVRWRARPDAGPGRTLLREVTASDGRRLDPGREPAPLQAGGSTLRFAFGTPGLAGESEILHETWLRGFADGQAETSPAGSRTFTNLPPGRYTFEARGRTVDGRWSEPARFAFTVLAPWWQTPGAIAGWVVLGVALLVAYIRWRIRGLTRARRRLEQVVAERTAELAEKNRELERLHRVDQDEKLAARLAEEKAQLELLRYQLNPHFLYNSLNSIRALVFTNAEAAGEMVTRLSEFCRWTLTRRTEGLTTVGDEMDMLQAYLDIERTRWQDGLRARIEVDPAAREDPLPQFLFLPLLENAIKYGGRTSPGVLEVTAHVRVEDSQLVCEVSNTGHWVAPESRPAAGAESTGIGLENLRQRLARHYGPDCRPEILTMPGWVCVRLRLPRQPKPPGSGSPV